MRAWGLLAATAVALGATAAPAQDGVLREDFEGPFRTENPPRLPWTFLGVEPGVTAVTSGVAARRGGGGLRIDDDRSAFERQATLAAVLPRTGGGISAQPNYYNRAFVRFTGFESAPEDRSSFLVIEAVSQGEPARYLVLRSPTLELLSGGRVSGTLEITEHPTGKRLSPRTWHLAEVAVTQAGSASACALVALDGVQVDARCGLDLSGRQAGVPQVGLTYQTGGAARGQVDFDDVAAGPSPVASTVRFTAEVVAASTGDCLEVRARGHSAFAPDAGAPFPFSEVVPLSLDFAAFSDAACQQAQPGFVLAAEAASATAFVKPLRPGTLDLGAQPRSVLLGEQPTFEVGGAAPAQAPLPRSCGCGAGASPAVLLLTLGLRRRGGSRCAQGGSASSSKPSKRT